MSAVASAIKERQLNSPSYHAQSLRINETDLRDILRRTGELPIGVPETQFTQVCSRLLDDDLFKTLISQNKTHGSDSEWALRLQKRETSLAPFIGHFLVCVFIRLPGCHYTIELDPVASSVVHWEWQPA